MRRILASTSGSGSGNLGSSGSRVFPFSSLLSFIVRAWVGGSTGVSRYFRSLLSWHCESLASTKQIEHTASNCSRPAWASSCYSEQSAGSRRWRSSNNPRKVRFADTVEVIWVPSRATYARCGIKDEIWWSSAEFREFKEASLIAQSRSATATSKASTATSKASTGSTSSLSRDSEEGPRDTLQRQRSFDNFMQANQSQMETLYRKMIIASPPPKMGMGMS